MIEKSTTPNNIIWSKFNQKTPFDPFLDILLNIFLFTSVIASSPVAWAQYLALQVNTNVHSEEQKGMILPMLAPFVLAGYNSGVIPTLVLQQTNFIFFELESQKVLSRLYKFYFFMILSSVFLQLTKIDDINHLIKFTVQEGAWSIARLIDNNLIMESGFYIRYLMTASFITQGIVLLDLPHWMNTVITRNSISDSTPLSKLKMKLLKAGKIE